MKRSGLRRRTPLKRTGRLRSLSPKRRAALADWRVVYAEVDARSGGVCEIRPCGRRATEHHHCRKPRASHNFPWFVVHLCTSHHRMTEAAYQSRTGRLVIEPDYPTGFSWWLVRGRELHAPDREVLALGLIHAPRREGADGGSPGG